MEIRPIIGSRNRVIIEQVDGLETTASGIVIPGTAGKPFEGFVREFTLKDQNGIEPTVKSGDRVIFANHAGQPITIKGKEFLIMFESDILAIWNTEK